MSAMERCQARISQGPSYIHHDACVRTAVTPDGLCKQHQKMYDRYGFIAVTTGYDGPVKHLRHDKEPTHD